MQVKTKKKSKAKKIRPLSALQEKQYKKRKAAVAAMGRMERKITELKAERDDLDSKLASAFEDYGGIRSLANGTVVKRKIETRDERIATHKGQVIQSGYSFPKYQELAGE